MPKAEVYRSKISDEPTRDRRDNHFNDVNEQENDACSHRGLHKYCVKIDVAQRPLSNEHEHNEPCNKEKQHVVLANKRGQTHIVAVRTRVYEHTAPLQHHPYKYNIHLNFMDKTIICPVGDRPELLFPALREFTVKHVHLLTLDEYEDNAKQLEEDLKKFRITTSKQRLEGNLWEDTFIRINEFTRNFPDPENLFVYVGTGDRTTQCAATSAAFVNGLRGLTGTEDIVYALPIMKFSYYSKLQDRKLHIMETMAQGPKSLNDIAKQLRISLSLLSYHVHGNRKSEGLIEMGLTDIEEVDGQSYISLSPMGRLLLKGYMPECEVC